MAYSEVYQIVALADRSASVTLGPWPTPINIGGVVDRRHRPGGLSGAIGGDQSRRSDARPAFVGWTDDWDLAVGFLFARSVDGAAATTDFQASSRSVPSRDSG
ncbi:MAG: hypothetical protein ACRDWA_01800 [Acidimicrobiia bacterium]